MSEYLKRMKKIVVILLIVSLTVIKSSSQVPVITKVQTENNNSSIAAGPVFPLGNFSSTHLAGIGAEYAWSHNRFGKMHANLQKKIDFVATGGVAHYFGKKEKIGSGTFKYPGYTFLHMNAGIIYNLFRAGSICLTAGPGLGIYSGNTQFNISAVLRISYYVSPEIAITPGLVMMKETGSDPLYSASLKAAIFF